MFQASLPYAFLPLESFVLVKIFYSKSQCIYDRGSWWLSVNVGLSGSLWIKECSNIMEKALVFKDHRVPEKENRERETNVY